MDQYCRNPQANKDPSWLYNVYTDEKLLCRHYQLQSIYHTDRSAFETMITVYGKYPEDGVIHCKNCGDIYVMRTTQNLMDSVKSLLY